MSEQRETTGISRFIHALNADMYVNGKTLMGIYIYTVQCDVIQL